MQGLCVTIDYIHSKILNENQITTQIFHLELHHIHYYIWKKPGQSPKGIKKHIIEKKTKKKNKLRALSGFGQPQ